MEQVDHPRRRPAGLACLGCSRGVPTERVPRGLAWLTLRLPHTGIGIFLEQKKLEVGRGTLDRVACVVPVRIDAPRPQPVMAPLYCMIGSDSDLNPLRSGFGGSNG